MYQKTKTAVILDKINTKWILLLIFILALIVRFYSFHKSTYFGYDEARDAYISQSIYREKDIKIVGPPASNQPGIYHGPLFWYLIGPLYLLDDGNPYFVSGIFRIVNALGVFVLYLIGKKLFDKKVGLLAGFIYAISFEQTQYAMYVGNPAFGVLAWMGIIGGAVLFIKERKDYGIAIMLSSAGLAMQFDFFLIYTFIIALIYLFLGRIILPSVKIKTWILTIVLTLLTLSTFIVSEFKYNFQTTKGLLTMFQSGYDLIQPDRSRLSVYLEMYINLFRHNILNIPNLFLTLIILGFIAILLKERNKNSIKILLVWLFAGFALLPFGMGEALYFNVGIGIGVIVAVSFLLFKLWNINKLLVCTSLLVIMWSNLSQIKTQNSNGLLTSIKPQPQMLLNEEISVINSIYFISQNQGFTIRVTGIPYGVQTVWAYLFNQYGLKRYGYLPYFETGNTDGFPGRLPEPENGTNCWRFLIQEPTRGIPVNLIEDDINIENDFSVIESEVRFGEFVLQSRKALDKNCHNEKGI